MDAIYFQNIFWEDISSNDYDIRLSGLANLTEQMFLESAHVLTIPRPSN
jgi:hypothetical protein